MATKNIITRGFGNGSLAGSIAGVVWRGYNALQGILGVGGAGPVRGRFHSYRIMGRFH